MKIGCAFNISTLSHIDSRWSGKENDIVLSEICEQGLGTGAVRPALQFLRLCIRYRSNWNFGVWKRHLENL